MIYHYEILDEHNDRYELWAHNEAEARQEFASANPGVDFEVFLTCVPFEWLDLDLYRQLQHEGFSNHAIAMLDSKLEVILAKYLLRVVAV